ncbi:MAG: vanadium-dependent haloperoxidase [Planctomycetes bacterium]|nr:vanadium-dependent haloperoxidase [Planctomycetota bacterium]
MARQSKPARPAAPSSQIVPPATSNAASASSASHDAPISPTFDRRGFLSGLGSLAAATTAAMGLSLTPAIVGTPGASAEAAELGGPLGAKKRRSKAYALRRAIAKSNHKRPVFKPIDNGDEDLYATRIGNFHKGLPHDANGNVDLAAYQAFLKAVSTGKFADFEAIPMGIANFADRFPLKNPQAGLAFDLEGTDVCQFSMPAAPALASAEAAGEMVEHYWQALLRDVHFSDYATDPIAADACAELSALSDFRGPKDAGSVTPQLLFRDNAAGTIAGPYVSQFLLRACPFGAVNIEQKMRTPIAGDDHMTDFATWLAIQNGAKPLATQNFDTVRRYIRNGRDLGQWVHIDVLYQAYFHAALILLTPPTPGDLVTGGGIGCPTNPGDPYKTSLTQCGFGTFGPPYIMTILTEVATRALKAVWFVKWYVNRKLRPEAYGGLVHRALANLESLPLHADVLNSQAVDDIFTQFGTYLLPQVFPEGSPLHPSYGSGHATVAGACVTILKAMFDGSTPYANPVVASADGLSLVPYVGADAGSLTVAGELDKLASNVAHGRNIAGVHWRSDAYWSLRLGEQVAISVLRDQKKTFNETANGVFEGFTFTTFDGDTITV